MPNAKWQLPEAIKVLRLTTAWVAQRLYHEQTTQK